MKLREWRQADVRDIEDRKRFFWLRIIRKSNTGRCYSWRRDGKLFGPSAVTIDGEQIASHRYAYLLFLGDIPKRMHVHHTCENPGCVNPEHLRLLTPSEHRRTGTHPLRRQEFHARERRRHNKAKRCAKMSERNLAATRAFGLPAKPGAGRAEYAGTEDRKMIRKETPNERRIVQRYSAAALAVAMERRGVTAVDLARRLGLRRQHVHAWMHGDHAPAADTLGKIADALGCSLAEFYVEVEAPKE